MPVAKLVIKDEVNVRIRGLDPQTTQECYERLSYYVPNYQFMAPYKLGRWDGKIHLYKKSGATALNLLSYVGPILDQYGYDLEVAEDNRRDYSYITDQITPIDETYLNGYISRKTGDYITLWDHQVEGVNRCLRIGSGILELATGSGKTFICGILSKIYQEHGRVVVIVPNLDLLVNTQREFASIGVDAGMWYGEIKERKQTTVATWQSLNHFPELFEDVKCVIVDEVHEAKAPVLSEMLAGPAAHVPFRFGCSGTIPKEEIFRRQLEANIAEVIFQIKSWELQEKGVLAKSDIYQAVLADSKNKRYTRICGTHQDWGDELNWFFGEQPRVEFIAGLIGDLAQEYGNTLVLIPYKKHGKKLQDYLPGSVSLDGTDKNRNEFYEEFNQMNNQILICTYGIAKKGIDIPRIFNLICIEPGKKFETVIQVLGRGFRKAKDKERIKIFDICSDSGMSAKHARQRRGLYNEARHSFEILPMEYLHANPNG